MSSDIFSSHDKFLKDIAYTMGRLQKPVRHELFFTRLIKTVDKALKSNEKGANHIFRTYLQDCRPFIFQPSDPLSGSEVTEITLSEEPVDLPYPCCHFEIKDKYISIPSPADADLPVKVWICSIVAKEVSPKVCHYLLQVEVDSDSGTNFQLVEAYPESENPEMVRFFKVANGLVKAFCERIGREKAGLETVNPMRVTLGSGKNKKFYKPKDIVHIAPKKYAHNASAANLGKVIDWTHRWEVRGHWRVCAGVGKDRDGHYSIAGFTWVINHVRGPETAPLIKKTYVV